MPHPLVDQLRFTRSEWQRALDGVTEAEAQRRFQPINCISWMVGHLAWQEQLYWMTLAQQRTVVPHLNELAASGGPASTPSLQQMWQAWQQVTRAADHFLQTLTAEQLAAHLTYEGEPITQSTGTLLHRVIYHYWYHIGEAQAVRQLLGHADLPQFVGDIGAHAPYRPA